MRWSEISSNPDDPRVVNYRRGEMWRTRSKDFHSVADFLKDSTSDSSLVVDVGYVNHDPETASTSGAWAHKLVREISPSGAAIIGLDPVELPDCDGRCKHYQDEANVIDAIRASGTSGRLSILAMNVIEHVDNPVEFLRSLARVASSVHQSEIWISTPNPAWVGNLYDWMNNSNTSVNVDHVALFGASELVELATRAGLKVENWGYLGRGDMPSSFRPGPGGQRLFWFLLYAFSRRLDLPIPHNQIFMRLSTARHLTNLGRTVD